ncbi:MAG: SDR family oxidoreductase [Nitrospiraceae bacterium]|nr:SDR family oxidoreductase [Nitrospiraceae bacterium]
MTSPTGSGPSAGNSLRRTLLSSIPGAAITLTKSMAVELAPDQIRVCAIAPVATDTPLLATFLGNAAGQREKFVATVPLGRLALPQDIADMALFLASADAKFLTGNIVEVDGGRCVAGIKPRGWGGARPSHRPHDRP